MKALLVYPKHPTLTYWSFSGALPYVGRRAALPPLGLVTVAAMLPGDWDVRLIDMNVAPLRDADVAWADVVLTSTMVVQAPSLREVVARCRRLGVPVVAGGPHPSASPGSLTDVDHVFVGEAEGAMAELSDDLERGRAKPVYRARGVPTVDEAPVPRFDLLDLSAYASMAVQNSRGCPFGCEFCDIWKLYGRRSRVKSHHRMTAELDALHAAGWRGAVFFVDDNFIGNRRLAERSLVAIERWQRARGYPFSFYTEASVNLGTDDEMMARMRGAGFSSVFLGVETPSAESLAGARKTVNASLDLREAIRRIQASGLEVSGGFIVGFDEDTDDIFERQVEFIRDAGIPMAMVGILTAIEGTDLYDRLRREGRLLGESHGNNTHGFEANFVTRLPAERLAAGYRRVMRALYDPTLANYFDRCRRLLDRLGENPHYTRRFDPSELAVLARSLRTIPTRRFGPEYLRFLVWCLLRHPTRFPEAVRLAIQGFHFEGITREALACDDIRQESTRIVDVFRERAAHLAATVRRLAEWEAERALVLRRLRRRIAKLRPDARVAAASAYADALQRIDAWLAEHAPSMARALEAGSAGLAGLREAVGHDLERIRNRHAAAMVRARRGRLVPEHERRSLDLLGREAFKRARRLVRQLPEEHRLFGHLELQALRRNLDDLAWVPVRERW